MARPALDGEALVRTGMCVRILGAVSVHFVVRSQCALCMCGGGRLISRAERGGSKRECAIVRLPWARVAPGSKWVDRSARASAVLAGGCVGGAAVGGSGCLL